MESVLLLDLDGVVRHFDKTIPPALEVEYGLESGSLRRAAFDHQRGLDVATGRITRAQWTRRVGEAAGSHRAAEQWLGNRGTVDPEMVAVIHDAQRSGTVTAVLTDGSDTIYTELSDLGIEDLFDHVFCSAYIGHAKPSGEVYSHVCRELSVMPEQVTFFDDTPANVDGAKIGGLTAHLFIDADQVRRVIDL